MIIQLNLGPLDNFSYIIYDNKTKETAIIDPGWEVERLINETKKNNLKVKYILLTHAHFDHSQEAGLLRSKTHAEIICHKRENFEKADKFAKDKDIINLGDKKIQIIETPGHTEGGLCYLFEERYLFTGDTIFTEGNCGRTDLAGGNEKKLKESIKKLLAFGENVVIYPGHNYGTKLFSTIKQEKCHYK